MIFTRISSKQVESTSHDSQFPNVPRSALISASMWRSDCIPADYFYDLAIPLPDSIFPWSAVHLAEWFYQRKCPAVPSGSRSGSVLHDNGRTLQLAVLLQKKVCLSVLLTYRLNSAFSERHGKSRCMNIGCLFAASATACYISFIVQAHLRRNVIDEFAGFPQLFFSLLKRQYRAAIGNRCNRLSISGPFQHVTCSPP